MGIHVATQLKSICFTNQKEYRVCWSIMPSRNL